MFRIFAAVAVAAVLFSSSPASADEKNHRDVAKKIIADYGKAVVPVTITMKSELTIKGAGQANDTESQQETLATIVDPSGLAFVQLPKTNQNEQKFGGDNDISLKMNQKITSIKLRLEDGTEVPVRIVLKDEDKGIAIVTPKTKLDDAARAKFKHLGFNDLAKDTDVLDSLIMITRLGKTLGSEPAVDLVKVRSKLTKPQPCFVCESLQAGAPVFDTTGKLVGLVFPRPAEDTNSSSGGITISFGLGGGENVLVPAGELTDLVKQALAEAEKPAKK